jgi:hypothetical protein
MASIRTTVGAICTIVLVTGGCMSAGPAFRPEVMVQQPGLVIEGLAAEPLANGAVFKPTTYAPALQFLPNAQYTNSANINAWKKISKPVRVRVPGRSDALYGLISFHELPPATTGPATRSYPITVPQSYVDAATNGRVSIVYETVPTLERNFRFFGWALLLSDRPF